MDGGAAVVDVGGCLVEGGLRGMGFIIGDCNDVP